MAAYAVFIRERMRDPDAMKTYFDEVPATFEGHEVVRHGGQGTFDMLEGAALESVVILEFPSAQAARAWYDSPSYRSVRQHRFLGADYRAFIFEDA